MQEDFMHKARDGACMAPKGKGPLRFTACGLQGGV